MIWSNFATIIWEVVQKNLLLGTRKMENEFFVQRKMKTSLGNIVWNSNMHPCAQYEIIWTNYAINVAIRLIIWLESHESSRMIAHFWEPFFKIITKFIIFSGNFVTYNDTMRRFSNFLNFLCPFRNAVKKTGMIVPS